MHDYQVLNECTLCTEFSSNAHAFDFNNLIMGAVVRMRELFESSITIRHVAREAASDSLVGGRTASGTQPAYSAPKKPHTSSTPAWNSRATCEPTFTWSLSSRAFAIRSAFLCS